MPQKVSCNGCGNVLYEGNELKAPDEIISAYDGKCNKCGKELSLYPINIEVKPKQEILKQVPLPNDTAVSEPIVTKLIMKLDEVEPGEAIEADFLETLRNGFNVLQLEFGLYNVTKEIHKIGGFGFLQSGERYIRICLDKEKYYHVTRIVEINFNENKCSYYEREDPLTGTWKEVDPKEVPLEKRKEYQTILMRRFEKLFKILSSKSKP